jgi:hypothetical protein
MNYAIIFVGKYPGKWQDCGLIAGSEDMTFFLFSYILVQTNKTNSVALVRKRTIPTERLSLVGEVSANFCGYRVSRGQRNGSPRQLISVF